MIFSGTNELTSGEVLLRHHDQHRDESMHPEAMQIHHQLG
jgi:hypothetical protein